MSIYASLQETVAWDYQGSHVLPKRGHPHTAAVDLAYIPEHISKRRSWIRLGVEGGERVGQLTTVLLDRKAARLLRDQLADWLDSPEEYG